jgi:iron complex transport system permease protein
LAILSIILLAALVASVCLGLYSLPVGDVFLYLTGQGELKPIAENILINLRLPRTILAAIAGAVLSISGMSLQGLFRNPLADPALIGASGGAALGAVFSIVVLSGIGFFSASDTITFGEAVSYDWIQTASAFIGSIIAITLTYRLATRNTVTNISTLLLAGIAVQAITSAAFGLLVSVADDKELRNITFWTLGSVSYSGWSEVVLAIALGIVPSLVLLRYARQLNMLQLGEHDAYYSGIDIQKAKRSVITLVALGVAAITSITGIVAFAGIIGPHITRLMFGSDHTRSLPLSMLVGAIVVLVADTASRLIIPPAEIPLGILTTAIGGPFFILLLLGLKRKGVI